MKTLACFTMLFFSGSAFAWDQVSTWYDCRDSAKKTYSAGVFQYQRTFRAMAIDLRPDHSEGFVLQPDEYDAGTLGYDTKGALIREGALTVHTLKLRLDCQYSKDQHIGSLPMGGDRLPASKEKKK